CTHLLLILVLVLPRLGLLLGLGLYLVLDLGLLGSHILSCRILPHYYSFSLLRQKMYLDLLFVCRFRIPAGRFLGQVVTLLPGLLPLPFRLPLILLLPFLLFPFGCCSEH